MSFVQICWEHLLVILSLITFFSFFHESVRDSLLFDNYEKLFLFGKLDYASKTSCDRNYSTFIYFALELKKFTR